jgi:hypothetical protein
MPDKLGPTGKFPQGKLNESDEGELIVALSSEKNMVRIDFGTPCAWVCLPPDDALAFAYAIIGRARAMMGDTANKKL